MIYLIKKAWSDNMENESGAAFGYKVVGYTLEDPSDKLKHYMLPEDFSWTFSFSPFRKKGEPVPMFQIQEISRVLLIDGVEL